MKIQKILVIKAISSFASPLLLKLLKAACDYVSKNKLYHNYGTKEVKGNVAIWS